jgi:hypothetical protein
LDSVSRYVDGIFRKKVSFLRDNGRGFRDPVSTVRESDSVIRKSVRGVREPVSGQFSTVSGFRKADRGCFSKARS